MHPLPQPDELNAQALHAMGWPAPLPKSILWAYGTLKAAIDAIQPRRLTVTELATATALARLAESLAPPAP